MPAKLKRLATRAASTGRKPFDPGRIRREQQFLLYAAGVAITLFILVCAALVIRLDVQDYYTRARLLFLQREMTFHSSLQAATQVLMGFGNRAEQLWDEDARLSPDALRTFSAQGGRLAARNAVGGTPLYGMAALTPDRPAESYARYLAAVLDQLDAGAQYPQPPADAEPLGGYLIGLDGPFLGVVGGGLVARARSLPPDTDLKALIDGLMPTGATRRKPSRQDIAFMLDRRFDPVVGRMVVRFARRLDDAAGRPFGWLLINGLFVADDMLSPRSDDEDVAVVDMQGNIVLGRQRDPAMIARMLNDTRDAAGEQAVVRRVGTRFVVGDRLSGTGLAMLTTFSWRSVAHATIADAGVTLGIALLAIALLWFAIVRFDRRALRPANRRAIRLIESDAFNRTLIRNAPAGLLLLSVADGETMVRNDVVRAYDSAASGQPLGKRIWHAYRERHAGDADRRDVMQQELAVERADHETAYLAAHVVRTRFRGVDVLLCTLTDVTARKLTEDKLREARAAADDANKAKSTFLATMSHEIRTPLNAIVGNLELMERAALPPLEMRRLKTIMSSSDVLLHMINDVLDLSKVESNQMALEHLPFDVRDVLRDVVAIFRPLAEAKHLTLECRIAPDLADGYVGDPTRLRQIVSNLVGNAIKFTEQGGVVIDARLGAQRKNTRCVEIAVRDTGVGIPPEALPTLFDVYIQADPSIFRRFGGTGLGLPLCRRIAEAMRGELTVETRPGEGSTFVAALPLPEAPAGWRASRADDDAAREAGRADEAIPALRVLVAEDHPASRALLRDQFAALGHDATIVANGVEAMRAYFGQPFDLVLTDLGMPELDGFALANFLREQRASVPVIAMTAHATDEDYRRCAQAGAVEVVLKPLSIGTLDAVLRRHAARKPRAVESGADARRQPAPTDEVRQRLREATLRSLDVMRDALTSRDIDSIRIELHSMRGGFALAGDTLVSDACARAGQRLAAGGIDAFAAEWPACRAEIDAALLRLSGVA
ncbi:sensor histidine kinase [Burkholderia sp. Bp9126]|nr:sensor histidine kinase [Burkholderia sp. Bp9126]